ncbi:MAG TPA: imidazole glycerol phosphate synthase subunit HisH [Gemmatimonadaceae bacterium]|nr:imidazole glycerol phosphate synthase subunit HisH [Gemmatimonadaceae bacterium]
MIVIVDYGVGNLRSIANMFRKIGHAAEISSDPETIERATKLVLPGVGAFDHGMIELTKRGLLPVLNRKVLDEGTPVIGLCLGMQLLARSSEEGSVPGLGWIDAEVVRLALPPGSPLKVPHMGWNQVRAVRPHPLLQDSTDETRFYFVHSYHLRCADDSAVIGTTEYGYEFPSVVGQGNVMGVQFHPEKSHRFGMRLLTSFAAGAPLPAGR